MADALARPPARAIAVVAALALGGLLGARFLGARKISASESLADALLDTEPVRKAARDLSDKSELRLAACAEYLLSAFQRAAAGWGLATGANDPIGYSRSQTHSYTQATASVLTEAHTPDHILTYAVSLPDMGEVRGTRRVGPLKLNGVRPDYTVKDTVQIGLFDDYTAQFESDLRLTETFVVGQSHLSGVITLRDNGGNIGRLNVAHDGAITGTVTREARIIGRFEGRISGKLLFKSYQIEPGDSQV